MTTSGTRAAAGIALLAVAPCLTGCGFFLTTAPPQGHEQLPYFSCTEANTGPTLDVIWASVNALTLGFALITPDAFEDANAARVGSALWGVLGGFSARSGFHKTERCRDAKFALAVREAGSVGSADGAADAARAASVTPAEASLAVGASQQLVATARDSSGSALTGVVFTWTSSNDAIASVDAAGRVTAHAAGTVVVAARTGSAVGTARIVVRER